MTSGFHRPKNLQEAEAIREKKTMQRRNVKIGFLLVEESCHMMTMKIQIKQEQ